MGLTGLRSTTLRLLGLMLLRQAVLIRGLRAIGALSMLVVLTAAVPAAQPRAVLRGHTLALGGLAYPADGRYLPTGSYDRTAKVWDAATGKELATLVGHTATVEAVAFSPDDRILATGSYDGTVRLWDWAAGKET